MHTDNFPFVIQQILIARRKIRIAHALSKVTTKASMRVINIGCGIDGRSFENFIPPNWQVIGVDLNDPQRINHSHPNFKYVQQDAQDLSQFSDKQFDLAICIGMLEHITKKKEFKQIASEIRRVAKQYIFIVPYKYCWIEPHYGLPFFPLYPYSIKLLLVKVFNLSNHREKVKRDPQFIKKHFMWLSNQEYKKEFPESKIYLTPTLETIAIIKKEEVL